MPHGKGYPSGCATTEKGVQDLTGRFAAYLETATYQLIRERRCINAIRSLWAGRDRPHVLLDFLIY